MADQSIRPNSGTPRWVKVFGIVVVVLVLVFIVIHLTVGGLGDHTPGGDPAGLVRLP